MSKSLDAYTEAFAEAETLLAECEVKSVDAIKGLASTLKAFGDAQGGTTETRLGAAETLIAKLVEIASIQHVQIKSHNYLASLNGGIIKVLIESSHDLGDGLLKVINHVQDVTKAIGDDADPADFWKQGQDDEGEDE